MNPIIYRRVGIILAWIVFSFLAGWIFHARYNEPEPPPRLDTQLPASTTSHELILQWEIPSRLVTFTPAVKVLLPTAPRDCPCWHASMKRVAAAPPPRDNPSRA
jgi:hypothetical protein